MWKKTTLFLSLSLLCISSAIAQPVRHREERRHRERTEEQKPLPDYGTNIIRLAPITAMDIGVGFGLSYEKLVGKDKMIGIVLPVSLILENTENSYPVYGVDGSGGHYNTYVYFTPGLKIYPFGQRRVTYAVGPNLMLCAGGGRGTVSEIDNAGNTITSEYTRNIFRFGMLINNYVNFQVTPNFNLGLEGGLGIRYIDNQQYHYNSPSFPSRNNYNGFDITGQFSLTLGFRF